MRVLAIWAIKGYQRYLSPHKGFRCAHAAFHGGQSCSGAVITILATSHWTSIGKEISQQFKACKAASLQLQANRSRRKRRRKDDDIDWCDPIAWSCLCWSC
ncbi:membrane protein insertion efficiency factor YidD [Photobacterium halotolerans]|uniref:membrane protein insertion efficiency factor YidD n=1 Tax=Photobacterium halotolerans TaxID=265726 RepID=UPI003B20F335